MSLMSKSNRTSVACADVGLSFMDKLIALEKGYLYGCVVCINLYVKVEGENVPSTS